MVILLPECQPGIAVLCSVAQNPSIHSINIARALNRQGDPCQSHSAYPRNAAGQALTWSHPRSVECLPEDVRDRLRPRLLPQGWPAFPLHLGQHPLLPCAPLLLGGPAVEDEDGWAERHPVVSGRAPGSPLGPDTHTWREGRAAFLGAAIALLRVGKGVVLGSGRGFS